MAVVAALLLVLAGLCGLLLREDEPLRAYVPAPAYETSASSGASSASLETPSTETFYVQGNLNVRSSPDRNGAILQTLNHGDRVQLGPADENGWAPLYGYAGTPEGYVYRASGVVQRQPPAPSGGSGYFTGPRGGCYTYSASGRKRYVDRSNCN